MVLRVPPPSPRKTSGPRHPTPADKGECMRTWWASPDRMDLCHLMSVPRQNGSMSLDGSLSLDERPPTEWILVTWWASPTEWILVAWWASPHRMDPYQLMSVPRQNGSLSLARSLLHITIYCRVRWTCPIQPWVFPFMWTYHRWD